LHRIITLAQQLIDESKIARMSGRTTRIRRSGKELVQFRQMLKAQRKKGIPVADLARQHGVSAAYIYMLPLNSKRAAVRNINGREGGR
jgi:hypothetical protein